MQYFRNTPYLVIAIAAMLSWPEVSFAYRIDALPQRLPHGVKELLIILIVGGALFVGLRTGRGPRHRDDKDPDHENDPPNLR